MLNKIDLEEPERLAELLNEINNRIQGVPVFAISNLTGEGLEQIKPLIQAGKTYCLLGSSGVGKSTLINSLTGDMTMKTAAISATISSRRQSLVVGM